MPNYEIMDNWAIGPQLNPNLSSCSCTCDCAIRCQCAQGENHDNKHDWQETQVDSQVDFTNEYNSGLFIDVG